MRRLLTTFLICFSLSCFWQQNIVGNWKVREYGFWDSRINRSLKIDLNDPEKSKREAYKFFQEQYKEGGGFKKSRSCVIDMVVSLQHAKFNLSSTGQFTLDSCDAIVPIVLPGLHLSNPVIGQWQLSGDTLVFDVQNVGKLYSFLLLNAGEKELKVKLIVIGSGEPEPQPEIVFMRQ